MNYAAATKPPKMLVSAEACCGGWRRGCRGGGADAGSCKQHDRETKAAGNCEAVHEMTPVLAVVNLS